MMIQTSIQVYRALEIPEIIKEILSYHTPRAFNPGNSISRQDAGTIVACTLCCKAFSDIALDLLWYEMIDLRPLFLLLPGIVLLNDNLLIGGELHEHTCSRFWSYARRIRRLILPMLPTTSSRGRAIDFSIYSRLALRFPGRAILPLLESLDYVLKDSRDMAAYASEFPMLLSGTVRELRVANHANAEMGTLLLSILIDKTVQLEHFGIERAPPRFFVTHSLRFTSLQSLMLLKCQDTFPDLARLLEQLLHLLSFSIGVTLEWVPSLDTKIPTNLLPNLQTISVKGPEESCLLVLQHISEEMLTKGTIVIEESWARRGHACLVNLSCFSLLREVEVKFKPFEHIGVDALTILDPLLGSLLIQHLRFELSPGVMISIDTIRGIASGLKNLKTLNVSYGLYRTTCNINCQALETIALFSPNLQELTLPINLTDLTDQSIPRLSCAAGLRSLELVTSSRDGVLIKRFVEALFPKLKKLAIRSL